MGGSRLGSRELTRREFLLAGAGAGLMVLGGCGGASRDQGAVARAAAAGGARYTGPKVELGFWNGFTGGDGPTIIYLAGLQDINAELYEAAKVDGANRWQRFWNVTLPGLRPVFLFIITVTILASANMFGQAYLITRAVRATRRARPSCISRKRGSRTSGWEARRP